MGNNLALAFAAAVLISAGLTWLLYPLLFRYALTRPNARSSHRQPTPQVGGIKGEYPCVEFKTAKPDFTLENLTLGAWAKR